MSNKKRIMLLEVTPLEPQPIVYATLDADSRGSGVTLSGGNLTITSATSTSSGRAKSTVPMISGQYYWEVKQTSLGTAGYVSSPGIMETSQSTTLGAFGFDGYNTAACPYTYSGNAWVYYNSVLVSTLGAWAVNTVIRNWYNADTGTYKIAINGGGWITVFDDPARSSILFHPAVCATRLAVFVCNFGASTFDYDVPSTSRAGVYADPELVELPLYISSSKFNTGAGDTNPNTAYEARISSKKDFTISRYASCYAWKSKPQSRRGSVSVVNGDGGVDHWRNYIWRDAQATILSGYEGDLRSAFTEQSVEMVDTVEFSDDFVVFNFLDPLSALDTPIPRDMYSSTNANSVTINTPYPKVFGNPQYCEGEFRSTATTGNDAYTIDLTDPNDIVEVVTAFDKGDLFDHIPTGAHRDFYATQNGTGIKLYNAPAGKITSHPTGPFQFDDTTTNRITNVPFAGWGTYTPPTGWAISGTAWNISNQFQDGTGFGAAGGARLRVSGSQIVAMYNSATSISAGRIVVRFTVHSMTTPGYICLMLGTTHRYIRVDRTGQFYVAMTSTASAQLVIAAGVVNSYSMGAVDFVFKDLAAYDAVVPEYLPEWMDLFASQYAGRTVATADVAAFVSGRNWRLAHYSNKEESISSVLQLALNGWMGCVIPKRNGELSVFGLKEPEAVADFEFDRSMLRSVKSVEDTAPGLTTRLAGRKNNSVTDIDQIAGGATATVRAELQKEWLVIRSGAPTNNRLGSGFGTGFASAGNLVVGTQVRHADGSPPQETALQDSSAVQIQASSFTTLWKPERRLYECEAVLDAAIADLLEPEMTIKITWPRYDLIAGKNLLLVGLQTGFWSNKVKFLLWG